VQTTWTRLIKNMEFNKNYIATYYTDIKNSKNYPEAFLYEIS